MAISANNSRTIEHPEIAFDKVLYGIQINPVVKPDGTLSPALQLTAYRARALPAVQTGGPVRWEKDPAFVPVTKSFATVEALVAAVPAVAQQVGPLWDQLNTIFAAVNTALHLV